MFSAKCLSAKRASKQGALWGEAIWGVLNVKKLSILSLHEFWVRGEVNSTGSPQLHYLRSLTVDSERQSGAARSLYQLWFLFYYVRAKVFDVPVVGLHFPSTRWFRTANMSLKSKRQWCDLSPAIHAALVVTSRSPTNITHYMSSDTFWKTVDNSQRIMFKLCMCSLALSPINSYTLNGQGDWQHSVLPTIPVLQCFLLWAEKIEVNIKRKLLLFFFF